LNDFGPWPQRTRSGAEGYPLAKHDASGRFWLSSLLAEQRARGRTKLA
jgi:hypothetical protein